MLNHFVTSYRFLRKSTTYTFINLSGLVLGLTAAFLLLITTINQLTYNRSVPEADRVYRVLTQAKKRNITEAITPIALASILKDHVPSIEKVGVAVRLVNLGAISIGKGAFIEEDGMICANSDLAEILGIKLITNTRWQLLSDTSGIIISEQAARKYFGSGEAAGKALMLKMNGVIYPVRVEAVFRKMAWNSTLTTDFIGSMKLFAKILKTFDPNPEVSFNDLSVGYAEILIRLKQGSEYGNLLRQSASINNLPEVRSQHIRYAFQPVTKIFLDSPEIVNDLMRKGKRDDLLVYVSLALFILVLAGVNYSILSTARSALRFREIGVRKVLGATRSDLRTQILTESVLLTFLAFPISFILLGLILPLVEPYFGHEIRMYRENMVTYLVVFPVITIIIGFLSGSYVAFFLASLDPLEALKSKFFTYKKFSLSKVFIVFQLFITLALLIAVINVYRQINHCLTQNSPGLKENLMMVNFNPGEFFRYHDLKKEIRQIPGVLSVSGASINPPTTAVVIRKLKLPGNISRMVELEFTYIDHDFFKTMGIPVVSGHEIGEMDDTAGPGTIYLNQAAEKTINLPVTIDGSIGQFLIKGVVKDYNFHTLHTQIMPSLFIVNPESCQTMIIRFRKAVQKDVLNSTREIWRRMAPQQPLDFRFYDQQMSTIYQREQNFGRVVGAFTILAFIITGMGLFGLAMLLSERRMKEMAIRKIFGATNPDIVYQMQKEFFIYLAIAALIATPATWYLMELWLNQFYYRIQLQWTTVLISVFMVAVFVSTTLLVRTMKVIRESPIKALKYE
jgi:putative ABC transport system permease protein